MSREVPVVFMTYDCWSWTGRDVRRESLSARRGALESLLASRGRRAADSRPSTPDWDDFGTLRASSRDRNVEGLMLKRLDSPYGVGRKRGDWWKWKIEPHTIDAVLIYAQPGSGKRASLLTDYTFGVWHEGVLVPIAKAYSGLSNDEIREARSLDPPSHAGALRTRATCRAGPVFELGFEAIAARRGTNPASPYVSADAAVAEG